MEELGKFDRMKASGEKLVWGWGCWDGVLGDRVNLTLSLCSGFPGPLNGWRSGPCSSICQEAENLLTSEIAIQLL